MPRKAQTKERFRTISIEDSLFQELHKHRIGNEPIYQTAHRMFHKNLQNDLVKELEDAEFMLDLYKYSSGKWYNSYQQLLRERKTVQSIERYV